MTIFLDHLTFSNHVHDFFLCVCVYVHIASAENFAQVSYLSKEVKNNNNTNNNKKLNFW